MHTIPELLAWQMFASGLNVQVNFGFNATWRNAEDVMDMKTAASYRAHRDDICTWYGSAADAYAAGVLPWE